MLAKAFSWCQNFNAMCCYALLSYLKCEKSYCCMAKQVCVCNYKRRAADGWALGWLEMLFIYMQAVSARSKELRGMLR